ncbi:zinc-ribbon domain-containing protein [Candidatus Pelagibacter sp.]|nr:zinc-ribbon domain-containing protein [Candidatus Pelagibacter sp.]
MIIACTNCNKKFNINSDLIPNKGRLLQCNVCNHKWFYKKNIINHQITPIKIEAEETISLLDITPKLETNNDDIPHKNKIKTIEEKELINELLAPPKEKKNYKVLGFITISLISFVAFIIILDTFKSPIGKIVPNIEIFLYNLYETLRDITLFFKDLF